MDRVLLYKEDAYWEAVRRTLVEVFKADPDPAERLRAQVRDLTPEQRLALYHTEPLRVAADLLGTPIGEQYITAYRRLIEGGQTEGLVASGAGR